MSSIQRVFTGTVDPRSLLLEAKAKRVQDTVTEVGSRMGGLDNLTGVDKSELRGDVDVSDAQLPAHGLKDRILGAVIPEKVSGFASYSSDGELTSLYTSSKDIGGTKELQYQRNEDGAQTYAVVTPQGQTTVRQNADGTLFMLEATEASTDDWARMSSQDFQAPAIDPVDAPPTIDDVKENYHAGVTDRAAMLGGLFSDETRGESLASLKKELLGGWNPFRKRH